MMHATRVVKIITIFHLSNAHEATHAHDICNFKKLKTITIQRLFGLVDHAHDSRLDLVLVSEVGAR